MLNIKFLQPQLSLHHRFWKYFKKKKKSDSSSQIKSPSENQTFSFSYQLLPPPHHHPPQELPDGDPLSREDQESKPESLS